MAGCRAALRPGQSRRCHQPAYSTQAGRLPLLLCDDGVGRAGGGLRAQRRGPHDAARLLRGGPVPGDQDARAAPHASNGPGLQQPGPRPPRQRPTRLQGCPHGPERRTLTARGGAKTRSQPCSGAGQRSRRICTAFLTFQVAQGCQAGGRAGSDARTAVGRGLV